MSPPNKSTILIIEDDAPLRQTLADTLELNGFLTVAAANGIEGLAAARRETPSLIITDIEMPGMTGFELLVALRQDEALRSVPVIVISAKVDRAATRRGMELGAADYISKPFTEDEVIRSITARLEKKELLDELDAFAHTVAHDLKNPLSTLNMRLELLGHGIGKGDDAALRTQLAGAIHGAVRFSSIIDELLVLAGVRRQAIVPQSLDMAVVVAEALDRLESILQRQSVRIEQPASWPAAVGHAPWIIEVWANFISNAAKYGGAAPVITLGGAASDDGRHARFWVQDNGPGLDADAQKEMFVPFTRISTVRASGHGLGLSIVRRIVEKLGGKVGVESAPGAGARFWFELPTGPRPHTHSPFIAS